MIIEAGIGRFGWELIIIAVFIALMIVRALRRSRGMRLYARRRGWAYNAKVGPQIELSYPPTRARSTSDLYGKHRGYDAVVFHVESGRLSEHNHEVSNAVGVRLPAVTPMLAIGTWEFIEPHRNSGYQRGFEVYDVDTGSEAFHSRYFVVTEDLGLAAAVLTPTLVSLLLELEPASVHNLRIENGYLLNFGPDFTFDIRRLDWELDFTTRVVAAIPPAAWSWHPGEPVRPEG